MKRKIGTLAEWFSIGFLAQGALMSTLIYSFLLSISLDDTIFQIYGLTPFNAEVVQDRSDIIRLSIDRLTVNALILLTLAVSLAIASNVILRKSPKQARYTSLVIISGTVLGVAVIVAQSYVRLFWSHIQNVN